MSEKAYIIGYHLGDLRARKLHPNGRTIQVDCSSTKQDQINLFKHIFEKYGHVNVGKPTDSGKINFQANLDLSFSFLLNPKEELTWILQNNEYFLYFFGGFIDVEGNFGVDKNNHTDFCVKQLDRSILELIQA